MVDSSRNYQNGKVYCIKNSVSSDIYVGSTTQPLSKRMAKHRASLNCQKCWNYKLYQKMREIGKEHFYIELIEKYECNDVEELRKKEGEWIRSIGTLNGLVAGRTSHECYYEKRDERIEHQKNTTVIILNIRKNMIRNITNRTKRKGTNKQRLDMKKIKILSNKKAMTIITKTKTSIEQETTPKFNVNVV